MNLTDAVGTTPKNPTRKRCGRGRGSGLGKTSGRGHKGAASRAGWRRRYGYDGGQTSLVRRLPKRGFTNAPFRQKFDVVNVGLLEASFEGGDTVSLAVLESRGLIKKKHGRLKVLGAGELTKKLTIEAHAASLSASAKVEAAGGKLVSLSAGVTPPVKAKGKGPGAKKPAKSAPAARGQKPKE